METSLCSAFYNSLSSETVSRYELARMIALAENKFGMNIADGGNEVLPVRISEEVRKKYNSSKIKY